MLDNTRYNNTRSRLRIKQYSHIGLPVKFLMQIFFVKTFTLNLTIEPDRPTPALLFLLIHDTNRSSSLGQCGFLPGQLAHSVFSVSLSFDFSFFQSWTIFSLTEKLHSVALFPFLSKRHYSQLKSGFVASSLHRRHSHTVPANMCVSITWYS